MNYEPLSTELKKPTYTALSHEAAAAKVNSDAKHLLDYTERILSRKEIKSWLMQIGKLDDVEQADTPLKKQFARILSDPDYSEIPVFDGLTQQLFSMAVADGLFTAQERQQVEDKARVYTYATERDVRIARLWDKNTEAKALIATIAAGLNNDLYPVAAALDNGDDADVPTLAELATKWGQE